MEKQSENNRCQTCEKTFSSISSRNQHIQTHDIDIKISTLNFRNVEEFQSWRTQDSREESYSCRVNNMKSQKGIKHIIYNCIRSNTTGYRSKCTVRQPRKIGSQFINGVCPSRISAKIAVTGEVSVEFVETHVGHEDHVLQLMRYFRMLRYDLVATSLKVEVCNKEDENNTHLKHNNDSIDEKYYNIQGEDPDFGHIENHSNNVNENNLNVGDRDNLQESTSAEEGDKTDALITEMYEQINIIHRNLSPNKMASYVEELKLLNKRFLEETWDTPEICKKIKIEKQINFPSET
ncbi:hypothetical protein GWI33_018239 [Rhynchophorus ferrugineus]|uniref:C2H2-type domain-containing protein n=1 Tax=Rhynchophorus ferrugineus TaxID=354439 RepID=A0A834HWJ7_RHYFE|nr:hypothetical protein GWI33_018239 [Rhynchophorus ferrugineus]